MPILHRLLVAVTATLLALTLAAPSHAAPAPVDTEPPSQPTGLWVCGADFTNSVPFCWTASTDNVGVVSYEIYLLQDGEWVLIGTSTHPLYIARGLIAGQIYTFRVIAKDAAGNAGAPSEPFSARAQEGLPKPTPTATPALSCRVTLAVNDWGTGYQMTIGITNTGASAIGPGWDLRFTLPSNMEIISAWSAIYSQNGRQISLRNPVWRQFINPGETIWVGFYGSRTGAFIAPTDFTLNGVRCSVG